MTESKFIVRKAVKEDMADVLEMIQELADFEKMSTGPKLTVEDLIRDAGFDVNAKIKFYCFVAEETTSSIAHEKSLDRRSLTRNPSIGFTICFFPSYATLGGRTLLMEDLYVKPQYRNLGLGKLIIKKVAQFAKDSGCIRIDFHVLSWNPAKQFYNNLGAINLTQTKEWQLYRIDQVEVDILAKTV